MHAYEVQPKDHAADFEIRRRKVGRVWLVRQTNELAEPCVIVNVSFLDGQSDGWELEFTNDEWTELNQTEVKRSTDTA